MNRRKIILILLSLMALAIAVMGIVFFIKPIEKFPSISFSVYNYSDSNKYTQASNGEVLGVSGFDINWVSGCVELIPYNGNSVRFEEQCDKEIPDKERMCYWKDNDTLRIQYTSSGKHNITNLQKRLLVYIPANTRIHDLDVDVVSADVYVFDFTADRANFETVSGDLFIKGLSANEIDVDSVSGGFTAEKILFSSLEGESVSGNVKVELDPSCKANSFEYDTVSGDVFLDVPEELGFSVEYDTVSGDFYSELYVRMISKKKIVLGDRFMDIEIDTVSGDFEIE